jgi:hypothetical protein
MHFSPHRFTPLSSAPQYPTPFLQSSCVSHSSPVSGGFVVGTVCGGIVRVSGGGGGGGGVVFVVGGVCGGIVAGVGAVCVGDVCGGGTVLLFV